MGFEEGAIVSIRNNRRLMRRSSQFTKVNTDVKKGMRKNSRYKNNPANRKNYELTKAYKAYALKRDIRTATIIIVCISVIVFITIKYFGLY